MRVKSLEVIGINDTLMKLLTNLARSRVLVNCVLRLIETLELFCSKLVRGLLEINF